MRRAWVVGGLVTATLAAAGAGTASALPGSGPPRCAPRELRLTASTQGATQATAVMVLVRLRAGARACRLRGGLRVDLARVHGVRGNPARRRVDLVLRPGAEVARDWAWRNWCGGQRTAHAVVSLDGAQTRLRVPAPVCDAARAPSTLSRLG
jgi:hypothetical protein